MLYFKSIVAAHIKPSPPRHLVPNYFYSAIINKIPAVRSILHEIGVSRCTTKHEQMIDIKSNTSFIDENKITEGRFERS